jgi:NADH-quinone oxidoreductase subunit M
MSYLLPLLLVVPIFGAILAAVIPRAETAKIWALTIAAITAALALGMAFNYDYTQPYVLDSPISNWLTLTQIHFSISLGLDSISLFLVLLTVLLVPLAICASFDSITEKPRQYYAWMLMLLACMIGVFIARDLLLFYAFFELTLVPSFFLIGIWGGNDRRAAAAKFFLYTFSGSVFTLAAIVYLGAKAGSFDIATVVYYAQHHFTAQQQFWVALGLFGAFVVKSAVFPLHTWLPIAYAEAPTPGTVLLAGVMPKLGTYGILRLVIPIGLIAHPGDDHLGTLTAVIGILSIIGILYGGLIAWVQRDMKRVLAYSSFSHLGFCVLGLMALNTIGLQGSLLYMINHGISTGALFLCVGMIYDRFKTTDQYDMSGLAKIMPKLAFFLVLFALSSIGLPGLNGFVSEFLTINGAFTSRQGTVPYIPESHVNVIDRAANFVQAHFGHLAPGQLGPMFGGLAALGVIISAIYMLHMVGQVLFGPLKTPIVEGPNGVKKTTDLTHREIAILAPLAILVVVLGVLPTQLILRQTEGPVNKLLEQPSAKVEMASEKPAVVALAPN